MASTHSSSLNVLFVGLGLIFIAAHLFLLVSCNTSFSLELIHRDSPKSPLYDPASTPFSRLHASIHRSASRANYLGRANSHNLVHLGNNHAFAPTKLSIGEYVVKIRGGWHKKEINLLLDTSSNLLWMLCHPCKNCYFHKNSIFLTRHFKTYQKLDCTNEKCNSLPHECDEDNNCKYSFNYIDDRSVSGFLSRDTFILKLLGKLGGFQLPNITFGCTHSTKGNFHKGTIGILGLNGNPLSFVRQLGGMFAHCLPLLVEKSSQLFFGPVAKVSGPGAVTTPLVDGIDSYLYYIILESIIVTGAEPIILKQGLGEKIVIDSGSRLTYIDNEAMAALLMQLKVLIPMPALKSASTPSVIERHHEICFDASNSPNIPQLPEITLRFAGGAVLPLAPENAFIWITDNIMCSGFASNRRGSTVDEEISILGSIAQINFRIGYDLHDGTVTFLREIC